MDPIADPSAISECLQRVSGALGKSDTHRRLLNFLAERSLRGDAPKEIEIAMDVLGRDETFNSAEDAAVRVNVRTLRQKLEEYYRGPGAADPIRFEIPKGAYRLLALPHESATVTATIPPRRPWPRLWIAAALALLASLALNGWLISHTAQNGQGSRDAAVSSSFAWSAVTTSQRPLTIVLGDLPLLSMHDEATGRTRLVRDPQVNTPEQIRAFLEKHATASDSRNQTTLVPKSVAIGLASVLPLVGGSSRKIEVTLLDELNLESLRENDVIYIGPLARLGPLSDSVTARSHFRFDADTFRLTDTTTQQTYSLSGEGEHLKDQGFFGSFPGPARNRLIVLASVSRDVGLLQVIRSMTSAEGIAEVRKALGREPGPGAAFEVLMSVSGYRRTNLRAEILDAHVLSE